MPLCCDENAQRSRGIGAIGGFVTFLVRPSLLRGAESRQKTKQHGRRHDQCKYYSLCESAAAEQRCCNCVTHSFRSILVFFLLAHVALWLCECVSATLFLQSLSAKIRKANAKASIVLTGTNEFSMQPKLKSRKRNTQKNVFGRL